jgi:hypothetical protein
MLLLSGSRNQAINNVVEGAAYMGSIPAVYGSASHAGGADSNQLRQNTLFDSGHYLAQADPGLDIKFNDLYSSHLQIMDLGTIYSWGTDGRGAEIAYNLVHDNWAEYNLKGTVFTWTTTPTTTGSTATSFGIRARPAFFCTAQMALLNLTPSHLPRPHRTAMSTTTR